MNFSVEPIKSEDKITYPVCVNNLANSPVEMYVLRHDLGLTFAFRIELAQLELFLLLLTLDV